MPPIGSLEKRMGITQDRMDAVLDPFMMSLIKNPTNAFDALESVEGDAKFTTTEKMFLSYHIGRLATRAELKSATRGLSEKCKVFG